MNDTLLVIISGRRPGDAKARPSERYKTKLDRIIISNDANGYITDIPIVLVPDDYRAWYEANHKNTDGAMWYAPMNRSYAIKYAREHGYRYLVQMDDNIVRLSVEYMQTIPQDDDTTINRRFRWASAEEGVDEFCAAYKSVLQNTNAAMAGPRLIGPAPPCDLLLREGFSYSFFMLDLARCPDVFHGDFEDDIEYRCKCAQMGYPTVVIPWLSHGKTSQKKTGDKTGCRAEYDRKGLQRGEHMSVLYGDIYKCWMTDKTMSVKAKRRESRDIFKHQMRPFSVGLVIGDMDAIRSTARDIFWSLRKPIKDKVIMKEKRRRS